MIQGKVYKLLAGTYYINSVSGQLEAKAKGSFRNEQLSPKVGDNVEIEEVSGAYRICGIGPRRNELVRPPVANIDNLVIVLSPCKPQPDLLLAERLLFTARYNNIRPLIVINKSELAPDVVNGLERQFAQSDAETLCVSCNTQSGLEKLKLALTGHTSCFAGQSAVGKSSISSFFLPKLSLQTGGLSKKTDRGRHTTRHCELFSFDKDSYLVDTPGFSLFDDELIQPEVFVQQFDKEYTRLSGECRFRGCSHTTEPDCGVRTAVEKGILSKVRYERYCKLYNQIKDNWRNRYD